jgi:hypothetical protein
MTSYLSGAEVLADARLRLGTFPADQGILVVEGRDDVRLFSPHSVGLVSLLPCGNKVKLLDAYARLERGEEARIVFVVDCDYDVPTGRLTPASNLIVTDYVDVESDLIHLGLLKRLILELVPSAVGSDAQLEETSRVVFERARTLAEEIGRFRLLSTRDGLGLNFERLVYKRYRSKGGMLVDREKLGRALHKTNHTCGLTPEALVSEACGVQGSSKLCNGKDMLLAIETVLHDDFGVKTSKIKQLDVLLRLAMTGEMMQQWRVVRRLSAWQQATGRIVLKVS